MQARSAVFAAAALAPLLGGLAQAASFDCGKAASVEERAVCADPRLSALDTLLGRAFREARKASGSDPGDKARLSAVARAFSEQRQGCGDRRSCLVASYAGALEGYAGVGSTVRVPSWIDADAIAGGVAALSRTLPVKPGQCVATRVAQVHPRLGGEGPVKSEDYESGTAIEFDNGGHQVSYEREQPLLTSHPGDVVVMCLIAIPRACPPGDDRGRSYLVTNRRTQQSWTLPDSQHMCGGA